MKTTLTALIEAMEKELVKMKEELTRSKEDNMPDFSKFIEREGNTLIIKGKEKKLVIFWNGSITFGKENKSNIAIKKIDKVTSTLTTLSKLKEGDVFILKNIISTESDIIDFNVMLGLDINGDIRLTYIENKGCDYLENCYWEKDNTEVYKINRF